MPLRAPLISGLWSVQYNFIFVVGEQEAKNGTVNLRTRDGKTHGTEFAVALRYH